MKSFNWSIKLIVFILLLSLWTLLSFQEFLSSSMIKKSAIIFLLNNNECTIIFILPLRTSGTPFGKGRN
ncbi:MAG: hypothetical protein Q8S84_07895 [bacterium]|nr:hypothetical protein [bacterium]MDP3381360.1 hypothetical protein [bacterium]